MLLTFIWELFSIDGFCIRHNLFFVLMFCTMIPSFFFIESVFVFVQTFLFL